MYHLILFVATYPSSMYGIRVSAPVRLLAVIVHKYMGQVTELLLQMGFRGNGQYKWVILQKLRVFCYQQRLYKFF